jgi:hypothetical protein
MNGYLKWIVPSVLVLTFSAAVYAQSSSKLDNRVGSQQKAAEEGETSGKSASKESEKPKESEANFDIHESGTKLEGKAGSAERKPADRESNRMGTRIERQRNNAAAPLNRPDESLSIDPN